MTALRPKAQPPAPTETPVREKRQARAAKPVDVEAVHKDIVARYPNTLARLAE